MNNHNEQKEIKYKIPESLSSYLINEVYILVLIFNIYLIINVIHVNKQLHFIILYFK